MENSKTRGQTVQIQDLHCLQIQLFAFLVLKELRPTLVPFIQCNNLAINQGLWHSRKFPNVCYV